MGWYARGWFSVRGTGLRWKMASIVILCVAALLPTAFSSQAAASAVRAGSISGQVKICPIPMTGKIPSGYKEAVGVYSYSAARSIASDIVGAPFRFRFVVAPGTYAVTAHGYANKLKAVVKPGRTVKVSFTRACTAG